MESIEPLSRNISQRAQYIRKDNSAIWNLVGDDPPPVDVFLPPPSPSRVVSIQQVPIPPGKMPVEQNHPDSLEQFFVYYYNINIRSLGKRVKIAIRIEAKTKLCTADDKHVLSSDGEMASKVSSQGRHDTWNIPERKRQPVQDMFIDYLIEVPVEKQGLELIDRGIWHI
ncbi:MAG: hypothetical protein ABL999_20330 [Pyrinomonadaceae bacterium]